MASRPNEDNGEGPSRLPASQADVTEVTHVSEVTDVTDANGDAEDQATEGATVPEEATSAETASLTWQERAQLAGRTPLPESRPARPEEEKANDEEGQAASPDRRDPRMRWRVSDIRRVLALHREEGLSYQAIQEQYYPHRTVMAVSQLY
ncbi:hypothetical protein J3F83DRAFT_767300 [Trichoderma novae-zelandiae]